MSFRPFQPFRGFGGGAVVVPASPGIIPDPYFASGAVGGWVSSRASSTLSAATNSLVVTKAGTTDGASINLTGLLSAGSWRLRCKLITTGASTRLIARVNPGQALNSTIGTIYDGTPAAGTTEIDVTFAVTSETWFGFISTWTNSATSFAVDDVILEAV